MARRRWRMAWRGDTRRRDTRCGDTRCSLAWRRLAWWMAWPLLSTSPLCVFPSSSPLRTVLRTLCQRLLVMLVLGPDSVWLAACLGLWPVRLRLLLSSDGSPRHAPKAEVDCRSSPQASPPSAFALRAAADPKPVAARPANVSGSRGRAAAVSLSLSFSRRPPEKSTSKRS